MQRNVAHFGGDPENVTIFGESGGGGKVSVLMAMPQAKGLFHKAIVESGSELSVLSQEEADAAARKFLAHLHIAPSRVSDLVDVLMGQLISALHSMPDAISMLGPVVDGRSLSRNPFDPDAPALSANVPMLIGTNADETRNLLGVRDPKTFSLNDGELRNRLKSDLHVTDSRVDALIGAYRKDRPNATPSDIYFAVTTDRDMRMDAITQAERKSAEKAAPAYMYIFAWPLPIQNGRLRAAHGSELPFVFDNIDKVPWWFENRSGVQPLTDNVSGAWAAFARTGNPNHAGLPHWPIYDSASRATMIFDDQCRIANDPDKEERLAISNLLRI